MYKERTKMDMDLLKLLHFDKKTTTIEIQMKKAKGIKKSGKQTDRAMGIQYQKQATARDTIVNRLRLKLLMRQLK